MMQEEVESGGKFNFIKTKYLLYLVSTNKQFDTWHLTILLINWISLLLLWYCKNFLIHCILLSVATTLDKLRDCDLQSEFLSFPVPWWILTECLATEPQSGARLKAAMSSLKTTAENVQTRVRVCQVELQTKVKQRFAKISHHTTYKGLLLVESAYLCI